MSRKMVGLTLAAFLIGISLLLFGSIFVKLRLAARRAPLPEAILVLGGGTDREKAAAQIAAAYPAIEVWVSTGDGRPGVVYTIFEEVGVQKSRVHLDFRATDTVTNFTTLVADFQQRDIQHLYLITSDFHMPRATVIAILVLGHSGITFTPIPTSTAMPQESWLRIARDGGRSLLWIATGKTGARLGRRLQKTKSF